MRLKDKVAIITGGAKGIGQATAFLFAQEGAKVIIADLDKKEGERTAREIKKKEGEALFIPTDVSQFKDVEKMVDIALNTYKKIDILFNNAEVYARGDVVSTSEETWDNIRVNCICPGPTDTPLIRKSRSKEQLKAFVDSLPSGRLVKPEEIAKAVLFLVSDDAASITGVVFPIDIGQIAHL